jgi:hypothetical protein
MRRLITIVVLGLTLGLHAEAAEIKHQHNPGRITFKILAVADRIPVSSFSLNRDSLLVMLTDETRPLELAKIKFTYMGYEYPFSPDLIDAELWHTFVTVRDRTCDETWQSFSTKSQKGSTGVMVTSNVLTYIGGERVPDVEAAQLLPCYVVRERGYKGSRRSVPNSPKSSEATRPAAPE